MDTGRPGLRERKKHATKEALRNAALRLALERGPENVRVDDIADAAGVSPRTYNNYYSSRDQAIVAAITAERESRIAASVVARAAEVSLSEAVFDAVVEQYTDSGDHSRDVLLMITTSPALRASYVDSAALIEGPLADALITRTGGMDPLAASVLSASVGAAVRVALHGWLAPVAAVPSMTGFVLPAGSLVDRMRDALSSLAPALDAAAGSTRRDRG